MFLVEIAPEAKGDLAQPGGLYLPHQSRAVDCEIFIKCNCQRKLTGQGVRQWHIFKIAKSAPHSLFHNFNLSKFDNGQTANGVWRWNARI